MKSKILIVILGMLSMDNIFGAVGTGTTVIPPGVLTGNMAWMYNNPLHATNIAYVLPSGVDAVARFGNPSLPWKTVSNAVAALNALGVGANKLMVLGPGDYTNSTIITCIANFSIRGTRLSLTSLNNVSKMWFINATATLQYADTNVWSDFSIESTVTNGNSFPITGSPPCRDVLLAHLDLIGGSDGLYAIGGEYEPDFGIDVSHRVTVVSCRFKTKWDTVYIQASPINGPFTAVMWYRFFDCLFWVTGGPFVGSGGNVGNVKVIDTGAYAEFHNCRFISDSATALITCIENGSGARILDNGNTFTLSPIGSTWSAKILNTNVTAATSVVISQNSLVTNAANGYVGNGSLIINRVKPDVWP